MHKGKHGLSLLNNIIIRTPFSFTIKVIPDLHYDVGKEYPPQQRCPDLPLVYRKAGAELLDPQSRRRPAEEIAGATPTPMLGSV